MLTVTVVITVKFFDPSCVCSTFDTVGESKTFDQRGGGTGGFFDWRFSVFGGAGRVRVANSATIVEIGEFGGWECSLEAADSLRSIGISTSFFDGNLKVLVLPTMPPPEPNSAEETVDEGDSTESSTDIGLANACPLLIAKLLMVELVSETGVLQISSFRLSVICWPEKIPLVVLPRDFI